MAFSQFFILCYNYIGGNMTKEEIASIDNYQYERELNNGNQYYSYDSQLSFTLTVPNGANYLLLYISNNGTEAKDLMIEIGSAVSDYEPYTSSTLSLPISTYFPTGMKSDENVYDELTENKAIMRIKSGDLGSLNWNYFVAQTASFFYTVIADAVSSGFANRGICSKYEGASSVSVGDKIFTWNGNQLRIRDDSFTSATDFKQAMTDQNVKLYYPLATPTETSFTTPQSKEEYPFFKSYKGGTEQLLPENGSVPVTAPILADMNYSSGAIEVTTYPNPEQGGETSGDGWYLVGEEATVNALPNEHYAFNNWVLDGEIVSTDPEYTFEVKDE